MCGIVGYTGKEEATDILLSGMKTLEYRGYDSAGITLLDKNNAFHTVKSTERVEALITKAKELPMCSTGIGHTRWATHGRPNETNAHPHLSENFSVVHNGIIENHSIIKAGLIKDGAVFKSDTDTEVIPHLMEKNYSGDLIDAVFKTTSVLKGSFAIAVLCKKEWGKIIAAKSFSPLIIGLSDDGNFVASDITAVLPYTKRVIYLDDGEIAEIKEDSVTVYDSNKNRIEKQVTVLKNDAKTVDKGGFAHFMLKEIYEQPSVLKNLADRFIKDNKVCFNDLTIDSEKIKKLNKIHIVACGSAYHAGVAGKYALESLAGIKTEVEIASEYRYKDSFADKNTLFIAISQSGETADTIAALDFAKKKGAHILSIVNVRESACARLSHDVLYTEAGSEVAVATTKGYSSQLYVLYLLAVFFSRVKNTLSKEKILYFTKELKKLYKKAQKVLNSADKFKEFSKGIKGNGSVFFIGRNTDYAAALEGSLKLKEISYIHSETYAAGELKHGTISLIEEGTPVIAVSTNKRLSDKTANNIKEVKSRGAFVTAVARKSDEKISDFCDRVIFLPETDDLFMPILSVIPLQLYAYYIALFKGCDIDKPRNLAKSVTVE